MLSIRHATRRWLFEGFGLLLLIVGLTGCGFAGAPASSGPAPAIVVEDVALSPQSSETVTVRLQNLSDRRVQAVQGKIKYDPSVMILSAIEPQQGLDKLSTSDIDNQQGAASLAAARTTGGASNGPIFALKVEAKGRGQTRLTMSFEVVDDANAQPMDLEIVPGQVQVQLR